MNARNRCFVFLSVLAVLFVAGCTGKRVVRQVSLPVPNNVFRSVSLSGGFDAKIVVGDRDSVWVTGPEETVPDVYFRIEDGCLMVTQERGTGDCEELIVNIQATVVEGLRVSGAIDANVSNLQADQLTVESNGASTLKLSGSVRRAEFDIAGACRMEARDLTCESASVNITGACRGDVHCSGSFDAEVHGVSRLVCYGNPEHQRDSVSGMSTLRYR